MPQGPPPKRIKGAKEKQILRNAVEDANRLLFTGGTETHALDADQAFARAHAPRPSDADIDKPHYHDHRARLRAKFDEAGAGALADYELLELLLFRIIPRRDTKPLAKTLLHRFGDLAGVLGAPSQRLAEVEGSGPAVALELKVLQAVMERAAKAELSRKPVIGSWTELMAYCKLAMAHAPREQFRVLFLGSKNQLLGDEVLNEGTVDHAPVYPREVARRALELSATSVILAHNHPSGDPAPSRADIAITKEIVAAAKAIGVNVHDHVIIGRHGAVSLKSLGLF